MANKFWSNNHEFTFKVAPKSKKAALDEIEKILRDNWSAMTIQNRVRSELHDVYNTHGVIPNNDNGKLKHNPYGVKQKIPHLNKAPFGDRSELLFSEIPEDSLKSPNPSKLGSGIKSEDLKGSGIKIKSGKDKLDNLGDRLSGVGENIKQGVGQLDDGLGQNMSKLKLRMKDIKKKLPENTPNIVEAKKLPSLSDNLDKIDPNKLDQMISGDFGGPITANKMNKISSKLENFGEKIRERSNERYSKLDQLGERLQKAAPQVPKSVKTKIPEEYLFNNEIPPIIPDNGNSVPEKGPPLPELHGPPIGGVHGPPERPIPKRGYSPKWLDKAQEMDSVIGSGVNTIENIVDDGSKALGDAAEAGKKYLTSASKGNGKFVRSSKIAGEVVDQVFKYAPWVAGAIIAYEFTRGNRAHALEMAIETGIPIPGLDLGDKLGPEQESDPIGYMMEHSEPKGSSDLSKYRKTGGMTE